MLIYNYIVLRRSKEGHAYLMNIYGGEPIVGKVKWFNNEKGYGFIDYKENEDIFVHYSTININGYKTLSEGEYVEFTLLETSKGYQAIDVTPIKEPAIVK